MLLNNKPCFHSLTSIIDRINLFFIILFSFVLVFLMTNTVAADETIAPNAIIIDIGTNTILMEKNSHELIQPASMSKLMLLYILFERLSDGGLAMDDTFPVSEKAWRMGGSKMFVRVNTRVTVDDLINGIIVQSGNDACIVVAEALSSSESAFAQLMTERAFELGLKESFFKNSTGWPEEGHLMSVADIAKLATMIIKDFPNYYELFAATEFTYNDIRQTNRNPLLYSFPGADGLKTGYTEAAGYGLVGSATRNGRRVVIVLSGLESPQQRARESERLFDWSFREFANYPLFKKGEVVTEAPLWLGAQKTVPLIIQNDLTLTMSRSSMRNMTVKTVFNGPIPAPIQTGDRIGTLVIEAPKFETMEFPLFAGASVDRMGFFGRLGAALNHLVWGAVQTAEK